MKRPERDGSKSAAPGLMAINSMPVSFWKHPKRTAADL